MKCDVCFNNLVLLYCAFNAFNAAKIGIFKN